ncbi:MAG: 2-amino-4-hydroxy-6-hydroxymethyldihydropteridine diphosphokinase [Crocinitomicaceae bacterium]|nr:MAG: 2-amino-4-hydroxy-6-hydroxymethyldihydropteridine diphosphokinase [Crocinitomicaceae bacterium]
MEVVHTYYLSLGSNLGDRLHFLQFGVNELKSLGSIKKVSCIYETEAIGFETDNLFLNACLILQTPFSPEELLLKIHTIEAEAGRVRIADGKYHSRPLDIDIIFFNFEVYKSEKLTIPHPKYTERKFVLLPLNDLSENLTDPVSKTSIKTLIHDCLDNSKVEQRQLTLFI